MDPRNAALYVRISSDPQGRRLGVERQREDLLALAKRLGWGVGQIYEDNDFSGSSGKVRPAFVQMREDVEAGLRDGVMVTKIDRLTRSLPEFARWMEWRDERSLPFATTEGDNTETDDGTMILGIKAVMAAAEARRIKERTRRAFVQRAELGKPRHGGPRQYGYKRGGMQLEESEADMLRESARRLLAGESLRSVTKWVNAAGHRNVNGGPIPAGTLRRSLGRPCLAGIASHKGDVLEDVKATWPAILTVDEHERLVEMFTRTAYGARGGQPKALLIGIAYCSFCGRKMTGRNHSTGYRYICNPNGCMRISVNAKGFELYVIEQVLEALNGPELASAIDQRRSTNTALRKSVEAVATARGRIERLELRWAMEEITATAYKAAREVRLRELADAEQARDKLIGSNELEKLPSADATRKRFEAGGEDDIDFRRFVVKTLIAGVIVMPTPTPGARGFNIDRVRVVWSF